MDFRLHLYQFVLFASGLVSAASIHAAEWKVEPTVNFRTQYNDNVRMRSEENIPEGSVGYTFDPRVRFKGEELRLWDMAIDARGRITRFPGIEDADSENVFFLFNGGRQTERSNWRLDARYDRNSSFDTDFDTANPGAGLGDDRTDRTTAVITPSVIWSLSETSQLNFSLSTTDVSYDERTNARFVDYEYDSAQLLMNWQLLENHKIGFTSSYAEYDSPESSLAYNQTVLQMDYTYTISPLSNISVSFGGRRLDSTLSNQLTGCTDPAETPNPVFGCIFSAPVFGDVNTQDDGTITNVSYNATTETISHSFRGGRTVSPSSFGGAQERRNVTYQLSVKNTERFTTKLILDAFETDTIRGNPEFDRTQYRFEPALMYRFTRNWNLEFRYRYLNRSFTNSNGDAESNAVFINLFLHWPKLVSSY